MCAGRMEPFGYGVSFLPGRGAIHGRKEWDGLERYEQAGTVYRQSRMLRRGYTTGTCAAAAAQAAAELLLSGRAPVSVRHTTPNGTVLTLAPEEAHMEGEAAVCGIRKDSGDDPDVTGGIRIFAAVSRIPHGIEIAGGSGVGRVTRPGLKCAVGEAAINPGPRAQITAALETALRRHGANGGLHAVISAENGEAIAERTYNRHLGIVGGISILGTSGIVEPMSETALIDTIHLELDARFAAGQRTAFLCPGNYGADFARDTLGLPLEKAVKSSNFIGEALDYAAYRGFPEILLVGHAGKLVKLAAGGMNTHSAVCDGRREIFTAHAALSGAEPAVLERLMEAATADACIEILAQSALRGPVLSRIGKAMEQQLARRLNGRARAEYIMFTERFGVLSQSAGARALCEVLK